MPLRANAHYSHVMQPATHRASLCSSSFRHDTMPDCFSTAKASVDSGFPFVSSARRNVLKVQSSRWVSLASTCTRRKKEGDRGIRDVAADKLQRIGVASPSARGQEIESQSNNPTPCCQGMSPNRPPNDLSTPNHAALNLYSPGRGSSSASSPVPLSTAHRVHRQQLIAAAAPRGPAAAAAAAAAARQAHARPPAGQEQHWAPHAD